MIGSPISLRSCAVSQTVARMGRHFGAGSMPLYRSSTTTTENKENQAPKSGKEDQKPTFRENNLLLKPILKDIKIGLDPQKMLREFRRMLITEEHHIQVIKRDPSGGVRDVLWCPSYVRVKGLAARGGDVISHQGLVAARGGDDISHHKCKSCHKIGLHLLNDGNDKEKYRPCLHCAGWVEQDIPTWYYHDGCKYCKI